MVERKKKSIILTDTLGKDEKEEHMVNKVNKRTRM